MAKQTDRAQLLAQLPDTWFGNLGSLSDASQDFATRWLTGCSEQLQRNLDTWTKLLACKDMATAAEIQQRWWRETADQFLAGAKHYQDQLSAFSRQSIAPLLEGNGVRPPRAPATAA